MRRFDKNTESRGFTWAYRDLLTAMLVVFIAMSALSLMAVTQPPKNTTPIQGNLIVSMRWDPRVDSDVDLWMKSPGDEPVGYRRMSGLNCNLLRDDLGRQQDPSSANQEMIICRNAPAGAYAINVMAYHAYDNRFPVDVSVESTYTDGSGSREIFRRQVKLTYQGEERTVARFELRDGGLLVPGSLNDIPTLLFRARE